MYSFLKETAILLQLAIYVSTRLGLYCLGPAHMEGFPLEEPQDPSRHACALIIGGRFTALLKYIWAPCKAPKICKKGNRPPNKAPKKVFHSESKLVESAAYANAISQGTT